MSNTGSALHLTTVFRIVKLESVTMETVVDSISVVLNETNMVSVMGNKVLVVENGQEKYKEVTPDTWKFLYENNLVSESEILMKEDNQDNADVRRQPGSSLNTETETNENKPKWTRSAVLYLLDTYKNKRNEFLTSGKRHTQIWEEIGKKMADAGFPHTGVQCKWKFNYLKGQFRKKNDNLRSTGASPFIFPYFNEMRELFAESHSANPLSLANSTIYSPPAASGDNLEHSGDSESTHLRTEPSASGGNRYRGPSTNEEGVNDASSAVPVSRRRRRTVSETIEQLIEEGREEKRKYQTEKKELLEKIIHLQERQLEVQQSAVDTYKEMMGKLLDKL